MPTPRSKGSMLRWLAMAGLAALVLLSAMACAAGPTARNPQLPAGLLDAPVPDVTLKGYVFFHPPTPIVFPLGRILTPGQVAALPPGVPRAVRVEEARVYLGPTAQEVMTALRFDREEWAMTVEERLRQEPRSDLVVWRQDSTLVLARGQGTWPQEALEALRQGRTVRFQEKHSEAWEQMRLLPDKPSTPPIAAGFVQADMALFQSLSDYAGPGLASLGEALNFVQVETAVFTLSADGPIEIPEDGKLDEGFLRRHKVGATVVTRSGLPGFVIRLAFGPIAGQAGLEKASVGDHEVYYRAVTDSLYIMVKNSGNVVLLTVAPEREGVEALMRAVLAEPTSG